MDRPAGWRGIVGLVKPTFRPGPLEEVIRLLPEALQARNDIIEFIREHTATSAQEST